MEKLVIKHLNGNTATSVAILEIKLIRKLNLIEKSQIRFAERIYDLLKEQIKKFEDQPLIVYNLKRNRFVNKIEIQIWEDPRTINNNLHMRGKKIKTLSIIRFDKNRNVVILRNE